MVLSTNYRNISEHKHKIPVCVGSIADAHKQETIYHPDGMELYQYFFCVEGEGELIISNDRMIIKPGMGFVIEKGVPHSYKEITPDWRLSLLGIDGELCQSILRILQIEKSGPFVCENMDVFLTKIREMYSYILKNTVLDLVLISKQCYDFLIDLSGSMNRVIYSEMIEQDNLTNKIVQYLEQHYSEPITIQHLAEYVGLSREYICTYFKKQTHQTIMNVLLKIRLVRARVYLVQYPSKKIYEIADMCGFDSDSYFCYVFRKRFGVSPDKYRRQNM